MAVFRESFTIACQGDADIHDITGQVRRAVKKSNITSGIGLVSSPGSTVSITTVEFEPGLVADLKVLFERLAPQAARYGHDDRWGDGNGHSHVRSSLLGPNLAFPVAGGEPVLGVWQQVVFIDFDNKSRRRDVTVTVVGE